MKKILCVILSTLMLISIGAAAGSDAVNFIMPKAAASDATVDFSFATPTVFDENGDPGYFYTRTVNGEIVPYVTIGKQLAAMEILGYNTLEELIADPDVAVIYNGAYKTASEVPAENITENTEFFYFNFVLIGNYNDCVAAGYTHSEIMNDIYCYIEPTNDVPGYYHANVIVGSTIPETLQFYTPRKITSTIKVPTGSYFSFIVVTEPMFNVATAELHYTKGEYTGMLERNINKEYVIFADTDAVIDLVEGTLLNPVLLRNHFNVLMEGGDGFKVEFVEQEMLEDGRIIYNRIRSQYIYYGYDFYFRVKIQKDYTASGMSVYVARGEDDISAYIGEDMTSIRGMLGDENVEQLTSYGVDQDGNLVYHVTNVTTNINVSVSGVNQASFANVLTMLKRILKLILDAFGIDSSRLGLLNTYDVAINCDNSISRCIVSQGYDDAGARNFQVMSGTNVAILVTRAAGQSVTVKWTPGNETGAAFTPYWIENENGTFQATFYIDNITANTTIDVILN